LDRLVPLSLAAQRSHYLSRRRWGEVFEIEVLTEQPVKKSVQ
jgi:hypothetical protein